jgi:Peptidase family C25
MIKDKHSLLSRIEKLKFRLMRKAFIWGTFAFLLTLFNLSTYGQKDEKIVINWNEVQFEQEETYRISFKGAHYLREESLLPFYHKQLNGSILNANITEATYGPLSSLEKSLTTEITTEVPKVIISKATEKKQQKSLLYILPFRKNPGTGLVEKLLSFRLNITIDASGNVNKGPSTASFASNSVLATGEWYRIAVIKDGIYKVDHAMLDQMGVDPTSLTLSNIHLYGNGGGMLPQLNSAVRKDDLVVDQNQDGEFNQPDYFIFYGQGPDRWNYNINEKQYVHSKNYYTDTTYYFITIDNSTSGKRIQSQSNLSPIGNEVNVNSFTDVAFYESDLKNFIKSGKEWYGETFDVVLNQRFNFSFPNLIPGKSKLKSSVISRTSTSFFAASNFRVTYNSSVILNHNVANVGVNYTDDFARASVLNADFNATASDINLDYTYVPYNSTSTGWLDFIALNVTRGLHFSGNGLIFRDRDTNAVGVNRKYTITNIPIGARLWCLRDHNDVRAQQFLVSGNQAEFIQSINPGESVEYYIFNNSEIKTPINPVKISNQNLHGLTQAEYIIITHPNFVSEAERLAKFHQDYDNLSGIVVTTQQIYNEFSSGAQDVSAVRDFIRMFYERATIPAEFPRYVLLMGDGSFDPKNRISNNTNFIPCFQSDNSISLLVSYTSDDFFTLLDPNEGQLNGPELPDVGIGRLPVRTLEDARSMVNKVITYSTPGLTNDQNLCAGSNSSRLGDWRNVLCFISDDQDRNLHQRQSERILAIAQQNNPTYNIDKINSDSYQQISTPGGHRYPEVNDAITKRVEKGALIMNYTGHGGELGWASESILNNDMINNWQNVNNMPAFVTATCEFSRYDDPLRTSAGEFVLLNSRGGGICLFTTVRLAFAIDNELINSDMMNHFFKPINGEMPRAGDIIRLSKRDNPSNRNVTLLGDPALRLAYPKHLITTESITESSTGTPVDTISALSKITVQGKVTDIAGNLLSNFNGVVFPTIYDKSSKIYNQVNDVIGTDISLPDSFNLRKNILYKGKASVVNGLFTCSFIVPKDISIQYGLGRLSYYANDGNEDAHGYNESFYIGGVSNNALTDNNGPEIRLYMNDENFIFGSITNATPNVYALLFDSSGINTVGNGIGHDITVQIDGKPQQLYVLNDFYESDLDSYQKGKVNFPLSSLSEGLHSVVFKAWDINNNSSESTTEFVVSSSAGLALDHVLNYPNPFTTFTQFMFEHNRPCTGMAIQVHIYTVSGKLVKTIDAYQVCEGFRNVAISWDGKDDYGDQLAKGVYVYRLIIRTAEGETAQKTEKLVLLR